jgi:hypothetical protein
MVELSSRNGNTTTLPDACSTELRKKGAGEHAKTLNVAPWTQAESKSNSCLNFSASDVALQVSFRPRFARDVM